MTDQMTISYEGDHVLALSNGEKNYQFVVALWTNVRDACVKHKCFDVLGIAETTVPVETSDALKIADVFGDLGIDEKFRIAWVEINPEAYRSVFFMESVLSNRGLPGRVFLQIEEAKNWLLGASGS